MSLGSQNSFQTVFKKLQEQSLLQREETSSTRIQRLLNFKIVLEKHETELARALYLDLRKNEFEAFMSEIELILHEINFSLKNIKKWMQPQVVSTPPLFLGTKSYVQNEPRGVVLILSPWNYPAQLSLLPLAGAIAAGNTVLLKPSEYTPHVNAVLEKIIDHSFSKNEVSYVTGDASVATELLKLPFDHIFFTGSTEVGKVVMKAAAENLSSVTLELGGKSPALVLPEFPIKVAAQKIAWGKFLNLGQTCVAPDYVFVHESQEQEFIEELKLAIAAMYGNDEQALLKSNSLGRVISLRHLKRLEQLLEKSIAISGSIEFGGESKEDGLFFSPTLVSQISLDSPLMQEEIFGPILPIIKYADKNEALKFINSRPKPLAFYLFSEKPEETEKILKRVSSGGVCVNDVLLQLSNAHLPFGGVGASGMGNYHGRWSFQTFSHQKAVLEQGPLSKLTRIGYPPYDLSRLPLIKKAFRLFL